MVVIPRTRMLLAEDPGAFPFLWTRTPERAPWRAVERVVVFFDASSSPLTEATDPVRSLFLTVPYPITTTSSRVLLSGLRTTDIFAAFRTTTSAVSYPMYETVRAVPISTSSWKAPSMSVIEPSEVPLINTDAPIRGSPCGSVTTPLTLIFSLRSESGSAPIPRGMSRPAKTVIRNKMIEPDKLCLVIIGY